jgi:nucleoside-diphosphate-sugar epimerase
VENLVDATMHLWAQEPAGFTVTNFIDKPDLTSREIAQAVADALGRPRPGPNLPMPLVLAMAMPFDAVTAVTGKDLGISSMRVKKLFSMQTRFEADALAKSGFRSAVPLREGIARMVRWWKQAGSSARPKWRQPPAQVQTF